MGDMFRPRLGLGSQLAFYMLIYVRSVFLN